MDDIRFATTVPVEQTTFEEVTSGRKTRTARLRVTTMEMPARPSRPSPAATTMELPVTTRG